MFDCHKIGLIGSRITVFQIASYKFQGFNLVIVVNIPEILWFCLRLFGNSLSATLATFRCPASFRVPLLVNDTVFCDEWSAVLSDSRYQCAYL